MEEIFSLITSQTKSIYFLIFPDTVEIIEKFTPFVPPLAATILIFTKNERELPTLNKLKYTSNFTKRLNIISCDQNLDLETMFSDCVMKLDKYCKPSIDFQFVFSEKRVNLLNIKRKYSSQRFKNYTFNFLTKNFLNEVSIWKNFNEYLDFNLINSKRLNNDLEDLLKFLKAKFRADEELFIKYQTFDLKKFSDILIAIDKTWKHQYDYIHVLNGLIEIKMLELVDYERYLFKFVRQDEQIEAASIYNRNSSAVNDDTMDQDFKDEKTLKRIIDDKLQNSIFKNDDAVVSIRCKDSTGSSEITAYCNDDETTASAKIMDGDYENHYDKKRKLGLDTSIHNNSLDEHNRGNFFERIIPPPYFESHCFTNSKSIPSNTAVEKDKFMNQKTNSNNNINQVINNQEKRKDISAFVTDLTWCEKLEEFLKIHYPSENSPSYKIISLKDLNYPKVLVQDYAKCDFQCEIIVVEHVFKTSRSFSTESEAKEECAKLACKFMFSFWEAAKESKVLKGKLSTLFQTEENRKQNSENPETDKSYIVEENMIPDLNMRKKGEKSSVRNLITYVNNLQQQRKKANSAIEKEIIPVESFKVEGTAHICVLEIFGKSFTSSPKVKKKEAREEAYSFAFKEKNLII
ncbi:hypothetical protein HK099_001707 [Clydaea vesicula]|uniref:DRBM domain-containing protein n=1 Tax=Clydaea vesicula TaxID=447962 RepID=A0AAD5U7Q5_9FUNG|nr:hypothetical protein HK099_001707 [Clydaea vesicula]